MKLTSLILLLVICFGAADVKKIPNKWYKTYEVRPKDNEQRLALSDMKSMDGIDFMSMGSKKNPAVVSVAPRAQQPFLRVLTQMEIPYEVVISDAEEAKNNNNPRWRSLPIFRRSVSNDYLHRFLRYGEIVQFLRNAVARTNGLARLETIGKSFENRPVYMIKLSNHFRSLKPIVMLEAGMHAREWAAPALALHAIHELIHNPSLLKNNDYYIIPVANPDGYEYTHTTDRFWRKTRSRHYGNECIGADGNRNFDTHWAVVGSSNNSCSETYHGAAAFSEIESRNIRDVGRKYQHRMSLYVALHSYGNFLLYPMGHSRVPLPDAGNMDQCGRAAAREILKNDGPKFTVGNTAKVLYPSGGGSDDYMKEQLNVPYAYTMELPGGGKSGFDLPPQEIESMVKQTLPGILTLAECSLPEE